MTSQNETIACFLRREAAARAALGLKVHTGVRAGAGGTRDPPAGMNHALKVRAYKGARVG